MKQNPISRSLIALFLLGVVWSCSKTVDSVVIPTKNTEKAILTFAFSDMSPAVDASISGTAISASVPFNVVVTALVPTITLSDGRATVSPASGVAQNFTNPITYTVTAQDGTTQKYTVTVIKGAIPPNNGTIFVANIAGDFFALDAISGIKKWQVKLPSSTSATPTVSKGIVYISCDNNKIYAFDVITGIKKWEFTHGSYGNYDDFSAPTVVNGIIYLVGRNKVFALDAVSGVKKWEFAGDSPVWRTSPTVVSGVLYVINDTDGAYALNAVTGTLIWKQKNVISQTSPAVVNGVIYTSDVDNVVAINLKDGSIKWKYLADAQFYNSAPTVANGIVYIGDSYEGIMYAIDAVTGKKKFEIVTDADIQSSPMVVSGVLYFGSYDEKLYAYNATTGIKKWEARPVSGKAVESSPIVANSTVFITVNNFVLAYDSGTGKEKWKFDSKNDFHTASPCFLDINGTIYYAGISGDVH